MKSGVVWLRNAFGVKGRVVAAAYRSVFAGTDEGRLVLGDLARYCRVGTTSFVPGDPHQTAFNEGARDVFLHIVELAGLSPADLSDFFNEETSV